MHFEKVRQELLSEAQSSPNLLSDLAGLEIYIGESYHNRSFIELLQNADDANASRFKVIRSNDLLFVANNGRTFNQEDLKSLCRSASSNKLKGQTIGYRGIGFKSVVGFSKEIHLLSGDLELTFSKQRTQDEIPQALRVPLIRIPHELNKKDRELINPVQSVLRSEGYTTIFVFTGVTVNDIESEFDSLEYNSLLFLRNVIETEISLTKTVLTKIDKIQLSSSQVKICLKANDTSTDWVITNDKNTSIAFAINESVIAKLPPEKSIAYAFLPTEDCTGLGVLLNGNFSTDPSRRHIIFDKDTLVAINECSNYILELLETNLKTNNQEAETIINSLIPYSDPRMLQFGKVSFAKLLVEELKQKESLFFKQLKICPDWLNTKDFSLLIPNSINHHFFELNGFNSFAKYLGASEIQFNDFKNSINDTDVSLLGCVQLTKFIFKSILTYRGINEAEIADLKILHSNGKRISLNEVNINSSLLDESFISLLLENGLTEFDIKQILKKYAPNINSENQFQKTIIDEGLPALKSKSDQTFDWFNTSKEYPKEIIRPGIKRWRSAEEQTLDILNLNGFRLEDVSKQNIGYDLSGYDPNGNEIQIEIKSITLPGQKFKLTNNEIAVAQEKRKSFYIAVVRQTENEFEIALISDPVNNLVLNRQCVQWIWECENYEYLPIKFDLQ